jgi:hypothetical protein
MGQSMHHISTHLREEESRSASILLEDKLYVDDVCTVRNVLQLILSPLGAVLIGLHCSCILTDPDQWKQIGR